MKNMKINNTDHGLGRTAHSDEAHQEASEEVVVAVVVVVVVVIVVDVVAAVSILFESLAITLYAQKIRKNKLTSNTK